MVKRWRHYDEGETYAQEDDQLDWSGVEELQARIDDINAIEDDHERREAARQLHRELAGPQRGVPS